MVKVNQEISGAQFYQALPALSQAASAAAMSKIRMNGGTQRLDAKIKMKGIRLELS